MTVPCDNTWSGMSSLTRRQAVDWIERWDRQQEGYLPDREERFTAVIDAVCAVTAETPHPVVLDLGAGPGSLATRLLDRLPSAHVIAIDTQPLLLALARAAHRDVTGLRIVDADLSVPGWGRSLDLPGPVDAAVSTTALHWMPPSALATAYSELADLLRPGGVLLNGDHLDTDDTSPAIAGLERHLAEKLTERRFGDRRPEDWAQWWEAAAADPVLSSIHIQRASGHPDAAVSGLLSTHVAALQAAGFSEVGTVWQHGNNRILAAVR